MPDTVYTQASLITALADNTSGAILAQTLRNVLVSLMGCYAQIYTTGGTTGTSVGTSAVVVPFATNGIADNAVTDAANERIQVGPLANGDYEVAFNITFDGTVSTKFTVKATKNLVADDKVSASVTTTATASEQSVISGRGILALVDGDYVGLHVVADGAAKTFTVREASLTIRRLG